jgi:hypothetical protein
VSTPVTTDREIVGDIVKGVDRTGETPSRNAVMREFGAGAGRAARLLAMVDQELAARSGPRRRPPVQRPSPPPDRARQGPDRRAGGPEESDRSTGADLPADPDQGPPADREPPQTGPDQTEEPDQTATDRSGPGPDHVEPDRSEPVQETGPDRTVQQPDRTEPDRTAEPDRTGPTTDRTSPDRRTVWPVLLLALPAFVAIWSGWVGLGELTGFGPVHPLPGIWDEATINSAITLPIGVETYAAYALRVWLSGIGPLRARTFAKVSSIGSLLLGAAGQIAYHLMEAAGLSAAPWQITTLVACIPVAVLGMGAALAHLSGGHDR